MNDAGSRIDNSVARPFEMNVGAPEKPVEPLTSDQTQTAVKAGKPREAGGKPQDEKLDLWMENIKEFIRKIDVKSL